MVSDTTNEAHGFLELGAPLKAWDMLEELPAEDRAHPDVLSLRLAICTALMKWELGLELLRVLEISGDDQHR